MRVNGFLGHQGQWPKQVLRKGFTANFKTKEISFYDLKYYTGCLKKLSSQSDHQTTFTNGHVQKS